MQTRNFFFFFFFMLVVQNSFAEMYFVQKGDNLWDISQREGVISSIEEMRKFNDLKTFKIETGQVIFYLTQEDIDRSLCHFEWVRDNPNNEKELEGALQDIYDIEEGNIRYGGHFLDGGIDAFRIHLNGWQDCYP